MKKTTLGYLGTVVFLLATGANAHGDGITISVMPASQTVSLGSSINVAVGISGLDDHTAPALGVFDVSLDFDPSILSFDGAAFGDPALGDQLDPLALGNTIAFYSASSGSVDLFDLSLDSASDLNSLQEPSFILATLSFDATGSGTSSLALTVNTLGDADGNFLSAALENGSISIATSAAPEPSAAGLAPAAIMLAAVCLGRRNRLKDSCRRLLNKS